MKNYPFTPELLDALPEELAELFRDLEDTLLAEICSRLKAADELNEATVQDIRALRSHGIDLKEIKKAIRETSGISKTKLDKLLGDVVARNQQYYTDMIDLAHITQPETLVDAAEVAAIRAQTLDTFHNLTASMGFLVDAGRTMLPPAKAYQWALDSATLQVQSGAINYNQAIKTAVKELADSGLKVVDYESGHRDHVDVAVRRAVMTGVSQICAKYTEQSAEYLDTPYFEVSAHVGARDKPGPSPWSSHKDWQGHVYLAGIALVALFAGRSNGAFNGRQGGQREGVDPVGRALEVHLAVVRGGRNVRQDQDKLAALDVRTGEVLVHFGHALVLLGDAHRHTGGRQPRVDFLAGVGGCVVILQLGEDLLQDCDSLFKRHLNYLTR